ncbi:MAG: hypothetical protein JHD02_11035 [Thermoleophilaceae bacterium]|nr:hypothetical protein [Thermoleophilaceae bacterium]
MAVVCAGGAVPATAAVAPSGAVPYEYNYGLTWHPKQRLLSGVGGVNLRNAGSQPVDHVWLRLRPNRGDALEQLTWVSNARAGETRAAGSMVRINLLKPLAPSATMHFSFGLRLRVPRDNTSLGRSAGIDLFGDALPVVAVKAAHPFRIGPEPAYGEGSLNPVALWGLSVRVPRGMRVIAPGYLLRTNRSRFTSQYITEVEARDLAFAIGRFKTIAEKVGEVRVAVTGSASTRAQLRPALRRAANAYRTLQRWYGGYSLPTLRVILVDLPFGGSEYPGIVFSTPDNATIAHEVAHQWFYGLVGNDQYNDPFLDESLTAFAEQRFHKSYRCDLARPIRGKHGLGTGMSYWEKHPKAYEDTIYRGGACALTVLRRDIGAKVFDQALRAYVAANVNQIAGVDDFLAAIRNAAPGYDLARWERLVGLD